MPNFVVALTQKIGQQYLESIKADPNEWEIILAKDTDTLDEKLQGTNMAKIVVVRPNDLTQPQVNEVTLAILYRNGKLEIVKNLANESS